MIVEVNGISLFYEKTGTGLPLLMLHGNGETHAVFNEAVQVLSKEFTVYAMDSRCHGKSGIGELHYTLMAEDVIGFIRTLGLKEPALCGFSDGGISGLLVAAKEPQLLSKLIVCGANVTPDGLRFWSRVGIRTAYIFHKTAFLHLMLKEPWITSDQLAGIGIPVLVLAGSRDLIREAHTRFFAQTIPYAELRILMGETHGSYVVHSLKLVDEILPFLHKEFF